MNAILTVFFGGLTILVILLLVNIFTLAGIGMVEVINTQQIAQDIWKPAGEIVGGFFDGIGRVVKDASDKSTPPPTSARSTPAQPTRVIVDEYPERRPDGSVWEVKRWSAEPFFTERLVQAAPARPQVVQAAPATQTANPVVSKRRETGKGGTLPFSAGEPVVGWLIKLANGQNLNGCYLAKAPINGVVTDGAFGEVYPAEQHTPC